MDRVSASASMPTVWILGDQLDRDRGALAGVEPGNARVLLVESEAKLRSKRWHLQRLHLVVSAMAHFAQELRAEGFDVDHRRAPTLADGLVDHRSQYRPSTVRAMEPMSWDGRQLLGRLDVEIIDNDQFTCSRHDFADWAGDRTSLRMEDFYRWQRRRLGLLMDGDEPTGGRWNFDDENRERPPRDGRSWPPVTPFELDDIDHEVLDRLPPAWGDGPDGTWPVTRDQALTRLDEFVEHGLAPFGPHEDAMLAGEWKLAHSVLSSSLNLGLLHPGEVVGRVESAYREGGIPINSAEGFIRQIIGWREYVWGLYWHWMPDYRDLNELDAGRPVPPALLGETSTDMACVADVMAKLRRHGWAHHIERLMVIGNLALLSGIEPRALTEWMWATFVDGAEWVMIPNVVGMALHADGGRMATKPYAAGGAYINRMSDHCRDCRFDPRRRTGSDACPFTTLYWDFLARHRERFADNHRMSRPLAGLDRLGDLDQVRERAAEVLAALDEGAL